MYSVCLVYVWCMYGVCMYAQCMYSAYFVGDRFVPGRLECVASTGDRAEANWEEAATEGENYRVVEAEITPNCTMLRISFLLCAPSCTVTNRSGRWTIFLRV